jgi:hypothetical protein
MFEVKCEFGDGAVGYSAMYNSAEKARDEVLHASEYKATQIRVYFYPIDGVDVGVLITREQLDEFVRAENAHRGCW